jgi:hypothetical protein
LTNDGVCLLFVEIILNAFDGLPEIGEEIILEEGATAPLLQRTDAVYFLLTLACSSNIGSALTYTGNPQNMMLSQDSIDVLPPLMFLGYMIIPSTVGWILTTYWIERCWENSKTTVIDPCLPFELKCASSTRQNSIEDGVFVQQPEKTNNKPGPLTLEISPIHDLNNAAPKHHRKKSSQGGKYLPVCGLNISIEKSNIITLSIF